MISLLLNDKYILLLEGTNDNGLLIVDNFFSLDTGVSLNELFEEPAVQIKVEKILKNAIEEKGMTTDEVVILLPDSVVDYKHILVDRNFQKNEITRLIPIEMEATFGDMFDSEKTAVYHLNNLGMRDIYLNDISLAVPVKAMRYAEKLIGFLEITNFSVTTENVGILNLIGNYQNKPKNLVVFNFLTDGNVEIIVYRQNKFYSIFKLKGGQDWSEIKNISSNLRFVSSALIYQFPDDLFEGATISASPEANSDLNEILPQLNIQTFNPIEFVQNIQTMTEVDPAQFIPYISLLGSLV